MQEPGTLNLTMWQGATWDYTLTWTISATPVNLTGYTARMQVRKLHSSPTAVLSLTNLAGITLGGSAGTIVLAATATQTAAITASTYVYDLELVSGAGVVTRLLEGTMTVDAEATR